MGEVLLRIWVVRRVIGLWSLDPDHMPGVVFELEEGRWEFG